jgi:hypothetical protein
MAVPPNIPTSFVPKAPAAERRGARFDMGGAFGFLCYGVLFVVLVLTAGVFGYKMYLTQQQADNRTKIKEMRENASKGLAQEFVRLDMQLNQARQLLDSHVSTSRFFSLLSDALPVGLRLTALEFTVGDDGKTSVKGAGIAKSFNTLASASAQFAAGETLSNTIFSKLVVNNKDNSVSFTFAGLVHPNAIVFKAPEEQTPEVPAEAPTATSTEQMP